MGYPGYVNEGNIEEAKRRHKLLADQGFGESSQALARICKNTHT